MKAKKAKNIKAKNIQLFGFLAIILIILVIILFSFNAKADEVKWIGKCGGCKTGGGQCPRGYYNCAYYFGEGWEAVSKVCRNSGCSWDQDCGLSGKTAAPKWGSISKKLSSKCNGCGWLVHQYQAATKCVKPSMCECEEGKDCTIKESCTILEDATWNVKKLEIRSGVIVTVKADKPSDKAGGFRGTGGPGAHDGHTGANGGYGGAKTNGENGKTGHGGYGAVGCSNPKGGSGGKGGKTGGALTINATKIILKGTIDVSGHPGKNGGKGGNTSCVTGGTAAAGGGGGGGGAGGVLIIEVGELEGNGKVLATGGKGGNGGNGGFDHVWELNRDHSGAGGGGGGGDGGNITILVKKSLSNDWKKNSLLQRYNRDGGSGGSKGKHDGGEGLYGDSGEPGEKGNFTLNYWICEFDTQEKPHGSIWCAYDEKNAYGLPYNVNTGDDAFGSSHWRFKCNKGKIVNTGSIIAEGRHYLCLPNGEVPEPQFNDWRRCSHWGDSGACNLDVLCQWISYSGGGDCVPKYPCITGSESGNCHNGDEVLAIPMPSNNCNLTTDYYTSYVKCMLDAASASMQDWFNFMLEKCTAMGDCGETGHFNLGVDVDPGYFVRPIVWPGNPNLYLYFECARVERLANPEKCEACNDEPKNCTPYRCKSFGSNCTWKSDEGKCERFHDDGKPPILLNLNITAPAACATSFIPATQDDIMKIRCVYPNNSIPPYSPLSINYKTDEITTCRWAAFPKGHEELEQFDWNQFLSADYKSNIYSEKHNYTFPADIFPLSPLGPESESLFEVSLFLICKDTANKTSTYRLEYILPAVDEDPPLINTTAPNGFTAQHTTLPIDICVNEPVLECRWDINPALPQYENLTNVITGFESSANPACGHPFTKSIQIELSWLDDNNLTIQCKDSAENIGAYTKTIKPAFNRLKIISVTPNNTIRKCPPEPASVTLKVVTDEGESNGKANCTYKTTSGFAPFHSTGGTIHTHPFLLSSGTYNYTIKCVDVGVPYNIAKNGTIFTVEIDTTPPGITRIYKKGNELTVHTDEEALCSFNRWNASCAFTANDWLKAANFSETGNLIHSHSWDKRGSYGGWFVRCYDNCSNGINPAQFPSCTAIWPQELE